jgi:hypothetical protein
MTFARSCAFACKSPLALAAGLAVFLGTVAGCTTHVPISDSRFAPAFDPAPLSIYRGRAIVMRNFENVDENTTIFSYPRSGPRRYNTQFLTSYFWYCFRNGFYRIGTRVYEDGQTMPGISVMDMRLVHIDDDNFTVDVTVLGGQGQPPFQRRYSVPGPPLLVPRKAELEAHAYQMMSSLFLTIVSDPAFQAVSIPAGPTY